MAKRQSKKGSEDRDADITDFDEFDTGDDYGDDLESLTPLPVRRLAALRAIECAREELALRRELEDFPNYL